MRAKMLMKRSRAALVIDTIAAENEHFSAMLVGAEPKEAFGVLREAQVGFQQV
jgi:hypothetical protein